MATAGDVRIGISGWTYAPWRGVFYPEKLRQKDELHYASNVFRSIEINGTFYSLQRPKTFLSWKEQTPKDFVFSVKGSRYITHIKRLRDVEQPLARFFSSGVLLLEEKLGPFLWQLPPSFRYNRETLEGFFSLLPKDAPQAVALAEKKNEWEKDQDLPDGMLNRKLRHAIEVRHESFVTPEFVELLRKYGVALVCADTVEWPLLMDVTSDFLYCRLHGSEVLYASGYNEEAIKMWGKRVANWAQGREETEGRHASDQPASKKAKRDVFVYFDNDVKVRAPRDAQSLVKEVASQLKTEPEEKKRVKPAA